jgi:hypothetical protein
MDNDGFLFIILQIHQSFLPRDYEQKEAKMVCPTSLGEPAEKYS